MLPNIVIPTVESSYPDRDWTYRAAAFFHRVGEQVDSAVIETLRPFNLQVSDYRFLSRNLTLVPEELQPTFKAADMVVQKMLLTAIPRILASEDPNFALLEETYGRFKGNCGQRTKWPVCIDSARVRSKP